MSSRKILRTVKGDKLCPINTRLGLGLKDGIPVDLHQHLCDLYTNSTRFPASLKKLISFWNDRKSELLLENGRLVLLHENKHSDPCIVLIRRWKKVDKKQIARHTGWYKWSLYWETSDSRDTDVRHHMLKLGKDNAKIVTNTEIYNLIDPDLMSNVECNGVFVRQITPRNGVTFLKIQSSDMNTISQMSLSKFNSSLKLPNDVKLCSDITDDMYNQLLDICEDGINEFVQLAENKRFDSKISYTDRALMYGYNCVLSKLAILDRNELYTSNDTTTSHSRRSVKSSIGFTSIELIAVFFQLVMGTITDMRTYAKLKLEEEGYDVSPRRIAIRDTNR